ncbi:MAG: RcnB family protein [Alphaproteobacteria bacterium]|nr:RcnB family protein [Alphaproteobacteria bacterium]MBL6936766.1 RcnB family protein [Alphaproteobacteria bacterium]MBL7097535.1 RcnB family protein [Alphaproteobacteria bacterium]
MRKLLLATAAVAGLSLASPAFAMRDHNGPDPNTEDTGGDHGGQGHRHGNDNGPPASGPAQTPSQPANGTPTPLTGGTGGDHHHDRGSWNGGSNNTTGGSNNTGSNNTGNGRWNGGDDHSGRDWDRSGRDWDRSGRGWDHSGRDWDRGGDHNDRDRAGWNRDHHDNNDWNRGWSGGNDWNGRGHTDWHNSQWNSLRRAFNAPRHFRYRGWYRQPYGWYYQRWTVGAFLPSLFWSQSYWIDQDDWDYYGLYDAPPGTVWVRYGNDALLIDRYTGEVIQVVYGIFY